MAAGAAGKPTVWEMVKQAVDALGGSTTNAAVRDWVWEKYPGTNRSTINCQIIAGCVNHPSRVHYGEDPRHRHANNPELDVFFRPEKGRLEKYDPSRHGKWEICSDDGTLSVRQVTEWPPAPQSPAPADRAVAGATRSAPSDAGPEPAGADAGEVAWMKRLQPLLESALQSLSFGGTRLRVDTGYRLPYAYEVMSYKEDEPALRRAARYQTDLLVFDEVGGGEHWVPRVVVECKIKGVTTHDALTYSGKAATHK